MLNIELIEEAFENRNLQEYDLRDESILESVNECISMLDQGLIRVAEPELDGWKVNEFVKKAVLLSFLLNTNKKIDGGMTNYFDKVDLKYREASQRDFEESGARVVPPAIVRKGSYIAKNVVLMPSYVNIGAYIDEGTMIDTWATVGSCAQIGKNVHISGGAGLGGVLEPIQSSPTIIEDNCFIGARSEIVEGVIVERDSVISMGVFIGQSTKIYDRKSGNIYYGRVPAGSVVVPGSLPSDDKKYNLNGAIIVKQVDEQTRCKVSINELLRDI